MLSHFLFRIGADDGWGRASCRPRRVNGRGGLAINFSLERLKPPPLAPRLLSAHGDDERHDYKLPNFLDDCRSADFN
jgi:hypothetical protein